MKDTLMRIFNGIKGNPFYFKDTLSLYKTRNKGEREGERERERERERKKGKEIDLIEKRRKSVTFME